MNNKLRYLFKNIGILAISSFASKFIVFFLVPLYTSKLSTSEFGTYDLIQSSISILIPILTLNVFDALMIFLLREKNKQNEIISVALKFVFLSFPCFSILILIIKSLNLIPQLNGYYCFIILSFFFSVCNQFFIQFAKGLEKVKYMGIAGVLGTVVSVILNIVFLLILELGIKGFFLASILTSFSNTIFYFFSLRIWTRIKINKIDKEIQKKMLSYSIPLIATTLGWCINYISDKYVVAAMCGIASNGILSVAYKLPNTINLLEGIFNQAWQISAIKEFDNNSKEFYGNIFIYFNLFLCAACSWLILLSKPIAALLYKNDFYDAWKYTPFLMLSVIMNALSGFVGPIIAAKKDSKTFAISAIVGAISNILLNILFAYFWGIQGVAVATAISSFLIFFIRKRSLKKELKIDYYWKSVVIWICLIIQSLIEIFSRMWILEICLMLFLFIINFKEFKSLFLKFFKRTT